MTIEEAIQVLGTGGFVTYDINHFLKCYQTKLWAAVENDELTDAVEAKLSAGWRTFNQADVINQIKENGKFVLDITFNDLDGVETCDACRGAGERFKFAKKPVQVGCLKCKDTLIHLNDKDLIIEGDIITYAGKDVSDNPNYQRYLGKVVEECTSCGGSGRYVVVDKEFGGKNDLECKTCHGINIDGRSEITQVLTKCKTCKGKRWIKIPVISPEIKSTTPCRKCRGTGYTFPKPEKLPMNPVISKDIASGIKTL
jgi:DnaJ-class molecular chaperone